MPLKKLWESGRHPTDGRASTVICFRIIGQERKKERRNFSTLWLLVLVQQLKRKKVSTSVSIDCPAISSYSLQLNRPSLKFQLDNNMWISPISKNVSRFFPEL